MRFFLRWAHLSRLTGIALVLTALIAVACPVFAQTDPTPSDDDPQKQLWQSSEQQPNRLRIQGTTVISLLYLVPTVTEKDDPRHRQNNQPQFNLRNAYLRFQGDIGHNALVRMTLAGRPVRELDVNDDGNNDDPNSGYLAIVLDRASLSYEAHPMLNLEAGVIRLPWSWTSQDVWGLGLVANSSPRRYGMIQDSDLGVSLSGLFPYYIGTYHWAVYNGSANIHPERTPHKATSLSLTFVPFYHVTRYLKRLAVAGFGEYRKVDDRPGDSIDERISWASLLSYGIPPFSFGAEWMTSYRNYDQSRPLRASGVGSLFLSVQTSWWSQVFVRADVRDPDLAQNPGQKSSRESFITDRELDTDEDGRLYLIAGARFYMGGYISIAPWFESIFYQETYQGNPLAPSVAFTTSLYLRF